MTIYLFSYVITIEHPIEVAIDVDGGRRCWTLVVVLRTFQPVLGSIANTVPTLPSPHCNHHTVNPRVRLS